MNTPVADSVIHRAVAAVAEHGSISAASRAMGIPRETLQHHMRLSRERGLQNGPKPGKDAWVVPDLPSADMPDDALIEHMTRRFKERKVAADARRVIPVKMPDNKPIAMVWLGDPHVDDPGCDWPTLRQHLSIIKATPGMRGCSLGDMQNNWVGRLARLYGDQETSHAQAWQLVRWLMKAIPWFILVKGNHDLFTGAGDPLDYMMRPGMIQEDWGARISLQFPNGTTFEIDAKHDHAGHSMWNELHAQKRAAMLDSTADLIIGGHRHTWGLAQVELPRGVVHLARARGYKFMDNYALVKGYHEQSGGHAIAVVIDPQAKGVDRVFCTPSVERAASYLTWLRDSRKRKS